jgi:ABC-2 type transport system ATP-binding protein
VRELVSFVASTYPAPMPVHEALELAGIAFLASRRVDRISGGQAQRVRFAVALTGSPELIVLDEPTAALDVEARRAFWQSMRGYAERGNTVLFSTHYLAEAEENADRIVVIDRGRVVAGGSGEEIRRSAGGALVAFDLPTAGLPASGLPAPEGERPLELAGLPGVTSAEVRGGRARLRSADSDATVLALAGLGLVRGLEVSQASLEDAFLALTSGPDTFAGPDTGGSERKDA